jgi:hypothetical protein
MSNTFTNVHTFLADGQHNEAYKALETLGDTWNSADTRKFYSPT